MLLNDACDYEKTPKRYQKYTREINNKSPKMFKYQRAKTKDTTA